MKLAGSHTFPFSRRAVWSALMDPGVLARTLPGCERLERVADDRFAGALQVAVGPVKGQFQGTLDLTELQPPERYRMRLEGQGSSGFVKGEGAVWLEEAAGGTDLHYDLDAEVGGRLAGVGQRLLESSARSVARQGLAGLEQQLRARHEASLAAQAARAAEAAATAAAGDAVAAPGGEGVAPAGVAASTGVAAPGGVSGGGEAVSSGPEAGDAAAPLTTTPVSQEPPVRQAPAPAAPSSAAFASRVARDVAADLVPPAARRWLLLGAVGLLAFAAILLARACGT